MNIWWANWWIHGIESLRERMTSCRSSLIKRWRSIGHFSRCVHIPYRAKLGPQPILQLSRCRWWQHCKLSERSISWLLKRGRCGPCHVTVWCQIRGWTTIRQSCRPRRWTNKRASPCCVAKLWRTSSWHTRWWSSWLWCRNWSWERHAHGTTASWCEWRRHRMLHTLRSWNCPWGLCSCPRRRMSTNMKIFHVTC